LTEMWAKEKTADSELAQDGYSMFRKDIEIHVTRSHGTGACCCRPMSKQNYNSTKEAYLER